MTTTESSGTTRRHPDQGFDARARALCGDNVVREAPLAPLTTFGIGGPADWLITIESVPQLEGILEAAVDAGIPVTVLGGGSNVLVADAGVRGAVIRLKLAGIERTSDATVRAESGVMINGLVRWLVGRGLAGLEAWAGTPGTVGGAIYGNAHWNRQNIGDFLARALVLSRDGRSQIVAASDMAFGYDTSRLQRTGEILVWAEFAVTQGRAEDLRARARASLAYRKRTQPLAKPSAGCIFQNPDPATDRIPEGIPPSAGALIDRAGLKNAVVGGARISDTHANFIVNDGGATAADVRALVERARAAVQRQFGVTLRDEVVYLGMFDHG